MSHGPDPASITQTVVTESDPSAVDITGLNSHIGISGERAGPARGMTGEVTHGAE